MRDDNAKSAVQVEQRGMTTAEILEAISKSDDAKKTFNEMLVISTAKDEIQRLHHALASAGAEIERIHNQLMNAQHHIESLVQIIGEKEKQIVRSQTAVPATRKAARNRR